MGALDLLVLTVYVTGTLWIGLARARRQTSVDEYFTTGRQAPWWVVMASIVATETSTVTVVSLPGFAFGTNLTFLQLVFGYLVGRVVVTVLFIPRYFRGEYLTAYQVLTERFGGGVGRLAATIFLVTRNLADGFRLFATGLVLGAVLLTVPGTAEAATRFVPQLDPTTTVLVAAILLLGAVTVAYTYLGGMSAVLWTDLLQLAVYVGGSVIAGALLLTMIPGGWSEVVASGREAGRLRLFDFAWGLDRSYTFWSGLVGGTFLTIATHGTDQLLVQRYLCSRSAREAGRALLWSGVVVLGQFLLFLLIGVMLFVYYTAQAPDALATLTVGGEIVTDRIFPHFIVTELPSGLRGLVVAAIFAAAMSTLSSSLNASASSTLGDFYMPLTGHRRSAEHYLRVARRSTVFWGGVQIAAACLAIRLSGRVVDEVLGISSFTGGLILGMFLLGIAGYRRRQIAYVGLLAGTVTVLAIRLGTTVSWQWYVLVGAVATYGAGWITARLTEPRHV
jgi:SSS family solute:Na+ symporter